MGGWGRVDPPLRTSSQSSFAELEQELVSPMPRRANDMEKARRPKKKKTSSSSSPHRFATLTTTTTKKRTKK